MGIGNDIKPKKVYRYKAPHHHSDPFSHYDEEEKEQKEIPIEKEDSKKLQDHPTERSHDDIEELEDDFFHNYNKKIEKKKEVEEEPSGFLFQNLNAKNITWLLLIALAAVVIYQNFDSIKAMVWEENTQVESKKDDIYVSQTKNSNENKNSNNNSNANTNLNANTAAATTNANTNTSAATNASISLQVLNGNGVAGSADAVASELKKAGFEPVKSSNARKFTYPSTIIYYKIGKEAAANSVKAALPDRETTIENSDNIVGTYDVVVVVGKN